MREKKIHIQDLLSMVADDTAKNGPTIGHIKYIDKIPGRDTFQMRYQYSFDQGSSMDLRTHNSIKDIGVLDDPMKDAISLLKYNARGKSLEIRCLEKDKSSARVRIKNTSPKEADNAKAVQPQEKSSTTYSAQAPQPQETQDYSSAPLLPKLDKDFYLNCLDVKSLPYGPQQTLLQTRIDTTSGEVHGKDSFSYGRVISKFGDKIEAQIGVPLKGIVNLRLNSKYHHIKLEDLE